MVNKNDGLNLNQLCKGYNDSMCDFQAQIALYECLNENIKQQCKLRKGLLDGKWSRGGMWAKNSYLAINPSNVYKLFSLKQHVRVPVKSYFTKFIDIMEIKTRYKYFV